jgi:ATP-dependent DNA helicase RecG
MTIKQLENLVKRGESETLEFKKSTSLLSAAMQTICAFLNSDTGGTVLIGVTDDKKIVGQAIADGTKKEISQELNKIEPHASPAVDYIHVTANRYVIVFVVKSGSRAPYVYDGRPFIRSQSITRKMTQEKYEQLLHSRRPSSVSWESLTTNDCTINDLDKKRIKQVVNTAISEHRLTAIATKSSAPEILQKFNLMVDGQLTNAAVVLFCKNEQKQFIQSMIKLARFRGTDKSEFIDNRTMRGNIFDLYERAALFLDNYLPIAGKIEEGNPLRVETPAIPFKALREALINAFCHRDYSARNGSIDIAIYDDRVEITNSGPLPSEIKVRELSKKHQSYPRNPLIAHVLYACHMIEQWGRGTLDMIELCKQTGNKPPKFEESTGSFSVIFPLREPISRIVTPTLPAVKLTNRQQEIMRILRQGSLSRKQIISKMENPPSDRTIQMELLTLNKLGLIAPKGKARAISWVIVHD